MRYFLLFISSFFVFSCADEKTDDSLNDSISVAVLKTEMLVNPEGIDVANPKLFWQIQAQENNVYQEAYQILVASSLEKLNETDADLWNSERVASNENIHIRYEGKKLDSHAKCFWKVRTWTNKGATAWSEPAYWSVGMLYTKDWWGRWIGFDRAFPWEKIETIPTLGARYFRKEFAAKKEIKSATAYIIGMGLYELEINGQKVGDAVLAPSPTDYFKNVKYNTYDVTKLLNTGAEHAIGVTLGNGRYFTMRQAYKPYKIKNFGFPKLLFHLEIKYADGSHEVIKSDDSWKGTADGPIRNNNEYDGEFYDARKEFSGWSKVGFDDSKWLNAEYVQEPGGDYQAQMNANMKVMRELKPVAITKINTGEYILDMGQNMVGWVQMTVKGRKGDMVNLKFAESLEPNGELFITNLRDAQATDTYILKGESTEVWEPKFTYHGFRYVRISGFRGEPKMEDFVGKMVYDEMETVGSFVTSDNTLNQIYRNAWWGIAGNYKGMPVDCPQRNERQPWLGDRAVGAYGENFVFDNAALYKKWLEDIRFSQKADGSIPDVAPAFWNYYSDNVSWPGTMLLITDMLYMQTGDVSIIDDNYESMRKWLSYMRDQYMDENGIITKDSYGDWCVPPATIEAAVGQNADVKNPSKLISTAFYYHFMDMMIKFADLTGHQSDIVDFQLLKSKLRKGFNEAFYDSAGFYGTNKMTDNILPLSFGLVDAQNEQLVFDHLVEMIEVENNGHLSTGLIGTKWLMRTLTKYGRADLAMQIATQRSYPSWGYMLENGATTIWELWHGNVANPKMNSQNHVMLLGDLIVWYFESLAGIKALDPGYLTIEMKPEFDAGLDFVDASYASIQGLIKSNWVKSENTINWEITIPVNTRAIIYIPSNTKLKEAKDQSGFRLLREEYGKQVFEVVSGEYEFVF
jgi:alpha-L-rhamnosidase